MIDFYFWPTPNGWKVSIALEEMELPYNVMHVSAIRRERVGRMHIEQASSLEKLTQVVHSAAPREVIYPVETALADIPALPLTGDQAQRLRNGQAIRVNSVEKGTVCAMLNDGPVAVARIDGDQLHPIRVFNFN